ncbi:MAG: bifunctional methionine sulfoxide reductase B/A protein [Melioribacteraceae bacterium]|nr:bifunctional methionine sulfoxide reductase B/A protein [Melioribacteraceae bacterium]
MNFNKLTEAEKQVIINKGTERPFIGKYTDYKSDGTYTCKQCDASLYVSNDKFDSHCGWPSFDDEIDGAIKRVTDSDGRRTEILCANCDGHLGHVFLGEGYTDKNTRHCVNSISLNFVPVEIKKEVKMEKAIFAGGCFWGMEYQFQKVDGVKSVISGYIGGRTENPSYKEVCNTNSGHAEAVEITYDASKVSYEVLAKLFFEIHDPTQSNGQGPDIGEQYRSEIFYTTDEQKIISMKLIKILTEKGYDVVTGLTKATTFYNAEDYHQDYYNKTGGSPYCHIYTKKF